MSGDNRYPSTIHWKMYGTIFHNTIELLEITFHSQGVDKLLEESVSQSDQSATKQKIKDTQDKLPAYQELTVKELSFGMSVKLLGSNVMYAHSSEMNQRWKAEEFRPAMIKVWMTYLEIFLKMVNTQFSQYHIVDMGQVLPTAPGLPFQVTLNIGVGADVTWKAKSEIFQNDVTAAKIQAELDSKVRVHGQGSMSWEVKADSFANGIEISGDIHSDLALKMNLSLDIPQNRFKAEIDNLQEQPCTLISRHRAQAVVRCAGFEETAEILPQPVEIEEWEEEPGKGNIKILLDVNLDSAKLRMRRELVPENEEQQQLKGEQQEGKSKQFYEYSFRSLKKQKSQSDDPSDSDSQLDYKRKGDIIDEEGLKDSAMRLYATVDFRYEYLGKQPRGHKLVVLKSSSAVKVTVKDITRPANPIVCFTYVELHPHKTVAILRAGQDCEDYNVSFEVEAGVFAERPALQAKFKYPRVPKQMNYVIDEILALLSGIAYVAGFSHKIQKNPSKEISMIMALKHPSECVMVVKLPEDLLYNDNCKLPYSVPMDPKAKTSKIADIPKLLLAGLNGQQFYYVLIISGQTCGICTIERKRMLSFNNQLITKGLPDDCFINVLGDCTCHKKLMVLMKYETARNNSLLIEIHTQNIICTMKKRGGELILEVNGTRLQDGVIPRTLKQAKVFRRPSGHIARDEVSFVQSWVVPDKCGGDCKLRHTTVRHENPILMAQCATNLPVARCAEGCSATSTTQTLASFHCVPTGSTLPTDLTVLAEKSEDMIELVESHTSCSCEQEQCAA
ncbi:hypothetical protein L345_08534, partial [Ophiophagus hannah]